MTNKTITEQQERMISLLLNGVGITDIAKQIGCSRRAIYDWLNRDDIKADMHKRRQDLINQGNQLIITDLATYIGNIKDLANDKSDKRVCLAANQYLINRIYGNPTNTLEVEDGENNENLDETELELQINKFKNLKIAK